MKSLKNQPLQERFLSFVELVPFTGCWLWNGATDGNYGLITYKRKLHKAHRLAFELFNGPIPKGSGYHGTCVLHDCDNRICVNPKHLRLGTQKDNCLDMFKRSRVIRPSRAFNPSAKLSEEQVVEIRKQYPSNSLRAIAKNHNVNASTIERIINHKTWI